MGQYDRTMKLLVDSNPEAMARFVLREWQKQEGSVLPDINNIAVTQLSGEFQSEELDADNVLLIEGPDGPLYLVEVEFQSTLHPYMPLRSLQYIARAKKKHWKHYGHLPVIAAVIYLFDDEHIPDSSATLDRSQWTNHDGFPLFIYQNERFATRGTPGITRTRIVATDFADRRLC